MRTDLDESIIARRLRAAADGPGEAPYDWAEYQRRRDRSMLASAIERHRPTALAAAVLAAALLTAVPFLRSTHEQTDASDTPARAPSDEHEPVTAPPDTAARLSSDWREPAHTRAIESWLAGLPREHVVVRVGTHAAVTSLQDQIAALDDLMSAERAAGARPRRLDALERQRAQLVSSLAQLRYAEMLASATP